MPAHHRPIRVSRACFWSLCAGVLAFSGVCFAYAGFMRARNEAGLPGAPRAPARPGASLNFNPVDEIQIDPHRPSPSGARVSEGAGAEHGRTPLILPAAARARVRI